MQEENKDPNNTQKKEEEEEKRTPHAAGVFGERKMAQRGENSSMESAAPGSGPRLPAFSSWRLLGLLGPRLKAHGDRSNRRQANGNISVHGSRAACCFFFLFRFLSFLFFLVLILIHVEMSGSFQTLVCRSKEFLE